MPARATPGSRNLATGQWSVGDLADGTTTTLTLRAKAIALGSARNTVTGTGTGK
ncbi:hypothetical protein ACFW95_20765 [Streptomyces sp. NPDC059474]|uniref:hypothetical protein n=1 Tax=unclassified Streptomyces TaxID=2593676 RepID=UPI0033D12B9D